MTLVEVNADGFVVDALVLAEAFALEPGDVQKLMRIGEITSLSETGIGEDAGRSRLTFHYGDRAVRLVVDQSGVILKKTSFTARSRTSALAKNSPELQRKNL
ncbi:DUF6522 family protein [Roseobacter sp. OBYS 0001]|uniref:DUF6522 family protein n=1 Tax=Roseobacter sp. OBYS 0001 TaxID=882651 RepID=UPI001BC190A5|nr:DUF6522 family protein [Roseobacter sp. OBYS 0001]GIT86845.1 hypothetical protein ROBYS_18610 [Roseobacter sp. OBYS 0001]